MAPAAAQHPRGVKPPIASPGKIEMQKSAVSRSVYQFLTIASQDGLRSREQTLDLP